MKKDGKGVVLTVEALLAAFFLFGTFLVASTLDIYTESRSTSIPMLKEYSKDILLAGAQNNTWLEPVRNGTDNYTRALVNSLPTSLCMQVEVYSANRNPGSLVYTYIQQNCTFGDDSEAGHYWIMSVNRTVPESPGYYWVHGIVFPRVS